MNILYDFQIFYEQIYGGVSRYHMELVKVLNQYYDCEIDIFVIFSRNFYLGNYLGKNRMHTGKLYKKIVYNHFIKKYFIELNKKNTLKKIEKENYDIIHITWTDPYCDMAAKGKLVVTIHDMIHELLWEKTEFAKQEIEHKKRVIYEAEAIIAISENTKQDILHIYPDVPDEKITVIYHGTNHLPAPVCPKEMSVPKRYFLYVGQRRGYKNASLFLDAVSGILKEQRDIRVILVGGGSLLKEEIEELRRLDIRDFVIQYNASDGELAYLYENAICFIYPTKYEGFGFPVLEAFDHGCPVICTNSSSLPEVGGNAALYFEPDNVQDLKDKINHVLSDENLRRQCAAAGRERVKLFDWNKTANETYGLYKKVMNRRIINL